MSEQSPKERRAIIEAIAKETMDRLREELEPDVDGDLMVGFKIWDKNLSDDPYWGNPTGEYDPETGRCTNMRNRLKIAQRNLKLASEKMIAVTDNLLDEEEDFGGR